MRTPMILTLAAAAALTYALTASPELQAKAIAAGPFAPIPAKAPEPKENPSTPAKVELGRMLYFDPRISKTGTISCNSCHNVMLGGDDGRSHSVGVGGQLGGRSAPTVWNAALLSVQFWDGRAPSLEEQAKGPMVNLVEMGNDNHDIVVRRISQIPGYVEAFKKAYPKDAAISIENAVKAVAAYERTLLTPNSAFDRYLKGDAKALSPAAQRGLKLVQEVGCVSCHQGPAMAGPAALPIGTGFFQKFPTYPDAEIEKKYGFTKDPGRMEATKDEKDRNMWRVPTWRNIALTAPYFHNGAVKTLNEAVWVMGKLQLNKDLNDDQIKDIVEFLNSLTGKFPEQKMPRLPELANRSVIE